MLHPSDRLDPLLEAEPGEVEEGEQVAVADVVEEVGRAAVVAVLHHLDEGEAEHVLVEADGPLGIAADQRHVVDASRRRARTLRPGTEVITAELLALRLGVADVDAHGALPIRRWPHRRA